MNDGYLVIGVTMAILWTFAFFTYSDDADDSLDVAVPLLSFALVPAGLAYLYGVGDIMRNNPELAPENETAVVAGLVVLVLPVILYFIIIYAGWQAREACHEIKNIRNS